MARTLGNAQSELWSAGREVSLDGHSPTTHRQWSVDWRGLRLISVGLTLVFGVLRIVNFAHGELLMLGMFAGFWAFRLVGVDPDLTALLILPVFSASGWQKSTTVLIRPVLSAAALAQFFCTIGLSVFFAECRVPCVGRGFAIGAYDV